MAVIDLKTKMPVDPYEFPERLLVLLLEGAKSSQTWYWSITELWELATKSFGIEGEDFAVAITTMLRQRMLRLKVKVGKNTSNYGARETADLNFVLGERAARTVVPEQTADAAPKPVGII